MPTIELENSNLVHRGQELGKLLQPLSSTGTRPAYERRITANTIIFAMHGGSRPRSNYQDWRFPTYLLSYQAGYFEIWNSLDSRQRLWHLSKAYLSIYEVDRSVRKETELLALHCDPDENGRDQAKYKRGPHLHISAAQDPIPKAHIALAIGHLPAVLASASSLTEALEWSILMIKEEVLDRL